MTSSRRPSRASPARGAGAEAAADRQLAEGQAVAGDDRVARVLAGRHGRDDQSLGRLGRHILHGVNGQIDLAVKQGLLDLLGEQRLAADVHQPAVLDPVARCGDEDQRRHDVGMLRRAQQPRDRGLDLAGLGPGEK